MPHAIQARAKPLRGFRGTLLQARFDFAQPHIDSPKPGPYFRGEFIESQFQPINSRFFHSY